MTNRRSRKGTGVVPGYGQVDLTGMSRSLSEHYDRMSWAYDILDWPFERFRYRALRPQLVAGLKGKVLEAGVGTGRNLPFYRPGTQVTGIDLSRAQLSRAARRTSQAACPVRLERADATSLPFASASFDSCLATFLFCVLPDPLQRPALAEIARVVRPGGLIRLLEYRYSDNPLRRLGMRLLAPVTEAVFGARFDRRTEDAIRESGLEVERRYFLSADVLVGFDLRTRTGWRNPPK